MEKPLCLGFANLELSKTLMCQSINYEKLQPYYGQETLQLHYMDCDSIVLSIRFEDTIDYLKKTCIII